MKLKQLRIIILTALFASQAMANVLEECRIVSINTDLFEEGVQPRSHFSIDRIGNSLSVTIGDWEWSEVVKKNKRPDPGVVSEYFFSEKPTRYNPKPASYLFRKYKRKAINGKGFAGGFFSINDLQDSLVDLSCN